MIYYEPPYGIIIIWIVNFLRTALLRKVMDMFLPAGRRYREIHSFAFAVYYLATAGIYSVFHVSAAYEMCNLAGILGVACLYRTAWGKRLWISLAFFSMDMGCMLAAFYGVPGEIQLPAVWVLLLLICVTVIGRIPDSPSGKEIALDRKLMLLLVMVPALSLAAFAGMMSGSIRNGVFVLAGLMNGVVQSSMAAFLCVVIVALNLCVFSLYHVLLQNYVQLREQDIYRQQIFAYQNQLEVIMESQGRIRALKHDMKNHILTLQALARASRQDALLEYLDSMQEFMVNPSEHVFTGNEALDSLLNDKLQRAERCLEKVEADIVVPEQMELHSFDLNVVFGNLLDNAIAASAQTKERLLKLGVRMDRGILFLHMVNSCQGMAEGVCDISKMTEKSPHGHGIGLNNVRRIVEKYDGDMEMNCREGLMETDIMLYMKKV